VPDAVKVTGSRLASAVPLGMSTVPNAGAGAPAGELMSDQV
jgi:hypothetical protein